MKKIILALILVTGLAGIGLSACSVPQNVASATSTQDAPNTQPEHEFHHTD